MKFFFSSLSSNILNYFWDITKNVTLSIYFLADSTILFFLFFFSYLESLVLSFFSRNLPASLNNVSTFFIFFLNSRYSQVNSFYLNFLSYLNLNQFAKATSDVLIFVALYSFFSIYLFTGSASVAFSNEGLWLSVLSLAVIYFFYYLRTLDNAGKDAISIEIDALKKLMLKNSELANEVSSLEDSTITFQMQVITIIEAWFVVISNFVDHMDSDSFSVVQIEVLVDSVFADHVKDLSNLSISRENLSKVISLKDFNEEVVSEVFDSNN